MTATKPSEHATDGDTASGQPLFHTTVAGTRWLSEQIFEISLHRPESFHFVPGQTVRLLHDGIQRDYSPASAPDEPVIRLCVRHIPGGRVTPFLAQAAAGTPLAFSGPFGYFTFQPSDRPAVFVATGTGVAPFAAMAASGITGFTLLHGVRCPEALCYRSQIEAAAARYVPCISGSRAGECDGAFPGRVIDYAAGHLPENAYDFYLCGRQEMTRAMTRLVDDRFGDSRLYIEIFY